jgi:geranylgeranyl reductase family protein
VLLEKETLPREKVCGGCLSRKSIVELPYSVESVYEQIIDGALLTEANGRALLKLHAGSGAMVRRDTLDDFMAQKAVLAGADLEQGCRFESYERSSRSIAVKTNKGTYRAQVIVGADGAYSRVRRQMYPDRKIKMAPAIEALVYPKSAHIDTLGRRVLYDLGTMRGGYGWIFPKRDHFNVGLYRFVKRRDNLDLKSLLKKMVMSSPLLREYHEMVIKSFSIPLQPVSRELAKEDVVLVGDAAGLAEGFYGEGIYHAIRSANIASECIGGYLSEATPLSEYNRRMFRMRFHSLFSRLTASVFYRLPHWATDTMLRNPVVNEIFGRLITGKMSPPQCFLLTMGLAPLWLWMPREEARPVEALL